MRNVFTIDADIKLKKLFNEPTVVQNDNIRFIISVFDNGQPLDITNVETVSLANVRLDGKTVVTHGSKIGKNTVQFDLGTEETKVPGRVEATAQFYDSEGRVSTISFSYRVAKDPTGDEYIPSEREQTLIETVLGDGPLVIQQARDAAEYATAQGDYAKQVADENKTRWLTAVNTYTDIVTTYPNPQLGDTVQTIDDSKIYRWNGTQWVWTQQYNANAITDVQNKITPLIEVVNEHLAEYETLLSKNAIMHNNIYRGKYLGNSVTSEQYQAISSGTFEDLYIGDYWTIGGVNYRIAGFDYYYYTGDAVCTTHHAVIVPDTVLYTHPMNDTNTTEGGYVNSKMYTEGLAQALSTIKSAFSGHVLKHRRLLSNAASNGKASGWAWFDSEVELMTEIMVYGSVIWGESTIGGSGYNIGVDKSQLPLFKLNPRMINTRQSYWLRDVVSVSHFAYASYSGNAYYGSASGALGVRPVFSIS